MIPYVFSQPQFFYLLGIIPVMIIWYVWQQVRNEAALKTSSANHFRRRSLSWKIILRHSLFIFRMLTYAAVIVALARPQQVVSQKTIQSEGIDIMLVLDNSGSMYARDFVPNRLEAAKNVASAFIDNRPNDRIGLVVFSSKSYTACPVTIDHEALKTILSGIRAGTFESGTAIGLGVGTAVNRLQSSESKSRIIILMTDGENNAGDIQPLQAAQLATTFGIKIYAIGMESYQGFSESSETDISPLNVPGDLLEQMAALTGGNHFLAMDEKNLASIYDEIEGMEKTTVDISSTQEYTEAYLPLAFLATILLMLELLGRYLVFRSLS